MDRRLPLALTGIGAVIMVASLSVGVIATIGWQRTFELPACTPEVASCFGRTREAVDENPAILWLGVMTLLLTVADVWALVQLRRRRTTFWVQVSGALLTLTTILTLSTLTTWWSFQSMVY